MPSDSATVTASADADARSGSPGGHRPGLALIVIAAARLMPILDATITDVALPRIQTELDVPDANLAWTVTPTPRPAAGCCSAAGPATSTGGGVSSAPASPCSPWPPCSADSPPTRLCSSWPAYPRAWARRSLTHGYTAAFALTAVMFLAAPAVTAAAVNAKRQQHVEGAPAVHQG
ncbi:hypothetical protein [Streptomyces sp. NPDC060002]|uniref:hypothetical protein n=1 Tax=Streptomyces sp. NPDC060002 TaxID=3347033 RepID=UPI0036C39D0D